MKRLLLVVLALGLTAVPARADDATQVAAALRSSPVYQASGLDLVDVATLTAELSGSDPQVYLAVLPASAASTGTQARQRAVEIGTALAASGSVVLVITASKHFGTGQDNAAESRGVDSRKALEQELKGLKDFTKDNLTGLVTSFAERVANQGGSPQSGVSNDGGAVDTGGGSGGAWLLGGLVALVLGGAAVVVRSSRQRRARLDDGLAADDDELAEQDEVDVLSDLFGDDGDGESV